MKKWQIGVSVLLAVILIGGAGYLGMGGSLPLAIPGLTDQTNTPEETVVPPTVTVGSGEVKKTIITTGQLVNYKTVELPAGISGLVAEVLVEPGDTVSAGQALVRFDDEKDKDAAIATARLALLEAQQALEALTTNAPLKTAEAFQAVVEARQAVFNAQYRLSSLGAPASEASLAAAQADVTLLQERYDRAAAIYEELRNNPDNDINKALAQAEWASARQALDAALRQFNNLTGSPTELTRQKAQAELALAQAKLTLAEAASNRLENGIDPLEYQRAQAVLAKAELELGLAEEAAEHYTQNLTLSAPFDGVVLAVNTSAGARANEGTALVTLADPLALEVLATVVEEDYPLLAAGQPVELYVDALPDSVLPGVIDRIIPQRASSDRPLYRVYIRLAEIPAGLVEGMTVDAAVVLDYRENVVRLPRALANYSSDGSGEVTIWDGQREVKREIAVGLRGDVFVEVLAGLEPGEQVVGK